MKAAVVGVIASRALQLGAEVLFPGHWARLGDGVGGVSQVWCDGNGGVIPVILAGAAIGLARHFTGLYRRAAEPSGKTGR